MRELGAHLAFLDESGFMLIPNVCKTWAPRGQTPLFRHCYRHDRISAISAVTVSPMRRRFGLYIHFHFANITSVEVLLFLRALLQHLPGHIMLLWDGGPIHRQSAVKEFLRAHPRLHTERFPAYAPELNPDEFVWAQAKRELSNSAPKGLDDLGRRLGKSIRRIRASQPLLASCLSASELPWP